jgi:hypothetical protein
MAVSIASNQAVLTIDSSGVRPASQVVNETFLLGHLTTGFSGSDFTGDALTCSATVPVSGPAAEIDRLEVGFVQVARAVSFQAFYAGRMPSEGGIALDYFIPPALNAKVLLDGTNSPRDPWYRNPTFSTARAGKRAADFGDHPGMVVRLGLQNRVRSNVRNFLFHCFMDREFFTIFTALEPGGRPNYIAHFQWKVRYEFRVKWRSERPAVVINQSRFTLLKNPTTGRPPEADLQALLDAPAGERANAIGKRVEAATVTGNRPNRTDNESRFITVPDDFWL